MRKIFKVLIFPALLVSTMQFSSCTGGKLHIHEFDYKYNEETHWQECKKCHLKVGETEHAMNDFTDRCFICNYHDPIIKTNESASVTGLTKHGKKKQTIDLDENILGIGPRAFSNSECTKIKISEYFIGFDETAFDDSKVTKIVDPDEELVEWHYHDGYWIREDKLLEYECMIKDGENTKFFYTFEDAIKSVEKNDVTITLLREEIETKPGDIEISNTITLEPLFDSCKIIDDGGKTNYYIRPSGMLKIPSTITFKSPTHLILGITGESKGESGPDDVYTSGSLVYSNLTDFPSEKQPSSVDYVNSDKKPPEPTGEFNATFSKQTTGSSLSETCNFAYGVFKMSKDFTTIKGLTDFGETCTKLHICRPINNRDFTIGEQSFVVKGEIHVPVPILPDPRIKLWKQKGVYEEIDIGDGITGIGKEAFANYIDGHIKDQVIKQIAYALCPIITVTIGNDVKYIENSAFNSCVSIDTIKIGSDGESNLEKIDVAAFANCYLLKKVDLSSCKKLKEIWNKAFIYCSELHGVTLAITKGWHTDKNGYAYLPEDMTPENVSMFFKSTYADNLWKNDVDHDYKFAYCKNNERDALGRFNKVHYTDTFPSNEEYGDNGVVYIYKNAGTDIVLWSGNKTINNSVQIIPEDGVTAKFGGSDTKLYIKKGKYLIVGKNIRHDGGTMYLERENNGSSTEFKNVGGYAQEYDGDTPTIVGGVVGYKINDTQKTAMQTTVTINNKKYAAVGLFDFNLKEESSGSKVDRFSYFTSLSALGKLTSQILVKTPVTSFDYSESKNECEINSNLFKDNNKITNLEFHDTVKVLHNSICENCSNLKQVIIAEGVKEIGDAAFKNCEKLWNVTIKNNNVLNKIGIGAFAGDTRLTEVDFSKSTSITSGWKAGETSVSKDDMESPSKAAELLSKSYITVAWTRS